MSYLQLFFSYIGYYILWARATCTLSGTTKRQIARISFDDDLHFSFRLSVYTVVQVSVTTISASFLKDELGLESSCVIHVVNSSTARVYRGTEDVEYVEPRRNEVKL